MGEDMFKDLTLSKEMMEKFRKDKNSSTADRLNAIVLQRSAWPFSVSKKADVILPTDVCLHALHIQSHSNAVPIDAR